MRTIFDFIKFNIREILNSVMEKIFKAIPLILVLAFILTTPNWNFIENLLPIQSKEEVISEEVELSSVPNDYEIMSLRTPNTKTYKKINNSYEMVVYAEDVHYSDNGEYKDIDNTIISKENYFSNKANKFLITFPKDLDSNSKVAINYLNYELQWNFNLISKSEAKIIANANDLKYNDIFDNVNLQYVVLNNRLKENIELEKYMKDFSFSYSLYTDLRIERVGNKLELYDEERVLIYTINEYYMYDANNLKSYDIDFNINQVSPNEYLFNVKPSDSFLQTATYPVIIDPEIVINNKEVLMGSIDSTVFDPLNPNYPGYYEDYLTITKKQVDGIDKSAKLYMNINFPSSTVFPQMLNLKNSNLLYAYVKMPNVSAYCPSGECKAVAKRVDGTTYNQLTPYNFTTTYTFSSVKFHSTSSFTHKFDIYDFVYDHADDFGTNFNLLMEVSLQGPNDSYVSYTKAYSYTNPVPEYRIGYSDLSGLTSYYTYEELPSSYSSVSYVGHNNGNLTTIYSDFSDNNLINLTHVYNSNKSCIYDEFGETYLGHYGYGFRLNYEESIMTVSSSTIRLTRGDGSMVDFIKKTNPSHYLAMDGSGDKIYGSSGSYVLKTLDNVEKRYNINNKLFQIYPDTDDMTNYVTITFNLNGSIYQIYDAPSHTKLSVNYDVTTELLDNIIVTRKNEVSADINVIRINYAYTNGKLSSITKTDINKEPDEHIETCNISYHADTNRISVIKDDLVHGLAFDYDDARRISRVEQVIDDIQNPPYLQFKFDNNGLKLTVEDSFSKNVIYTFDRFFHTKSVTNTYGYTSFIEYIDIYYPGGVWTTDPNYYKNNRIIASSNQFKNNINLVNNHSFEISDSLKYWTNASSGGTASIIKDISTSLYGPRVLRLNKPQTINSAKVTQNIKVKQGKTYVVSGYIKNENSTGIGAYIDVTSSFITINQGNRSQSVKGSKNYTYYKIEFTANSNTNVTISLINDSVGEAFFDMIQVNDNTIDTRYNFIENASFENGTTAWLGLDSFELVQNVSGTTLFDNTIMGETAAKFTNQISQTINVSGNAGDIFVFGGSMYVDNIVANCSISLTFNYSSSAAQTITYDSNDPNIQYKMYKAVAEQSYTSITFRVTNNSTREYITIDNMALYKEGYGASISYTDTGKTSSTFNEITNSLIEYEYDDTTDNLTNVRESNVSNDLTYQSGKDWISSVATNNVTQNYKRDENGYIIELALTIPDPTNPNLKIYQFAKSTEYTPDKLYIKKEVNEFNQVQEYVFDYLTGLLKSSKNNYVTTNYSYDVLGNTTSINSGNRTVTYGYEGKKLTSISVDGMIYDFVYNSYGDITEIKIAGQTIINNSYKNENTSQYQGQIDKTTYGNTIVGITYDNEGRITLLEKVTYDQFEQEVRIPLLEYVYDSMGNIAKTIDYKANISYFYDFDEENRLVKITSSDGNDVIYSYNDDGFLSTKENANGEIIYDYLPFGEEPVDPNVKNANKWILDEDFGLFSKHYNYQNNGLQKLNSSAIITSAASITSSYTYDSFSKYVDGEIRNYQTLRVKELNITVLRNQTTTKLMKLVYAYDLYGNISSITRYNNGSSQYTYIEYFSYNEDSGTSQLDMHWIEYPDGTHDKSEYFSYDTRGNITNYYKFGLNEEYQIIFTYNTVGWIDQLETFTKYDFYNQETTVYNIGDFDSIGNLSSFKDFSITYDNRSITKFVDGINSYIYEYNASNIRTSKNVNGYITEYILEGSNIIREIRYEDPEVSGDDYAINYYYDSKGNIIALSIDNNIYDEVTYNLFYSYIKNLQNDIIGIIDVNGNLVVEYMYDAYGSIRIITDTSGISLSTKNPFKFKSYYYDNETGFYYLNSRFYDPIVGRFINADDASVALSVGDLNLYSYCNNNPVMGYDPMGTWNLGVFRKIGAAVLGAAIGATVGFLVGGPAGAIVGVVVGANAGIELIKEHYSRNQYNIDLPQTVKNAKENDWENEAANYHQNNTINGPNVKYISPDGKREVIFYSDGITINKTPEDEGTYNFASPKTNPIGHFFLDMLPYYLWGNSEDDATPPLKRIFGN